MYIQIKLIQMEGWDEDFKKFIAELNIAVEGMTSINARPKRQWSFEQGWWKKIK